MGVCRCGNLEQGTHCVCLCIMSTRCDPGRHFSGHTAGSGWVGAAVVLQTSIWAHCWLWVGGVFVLVLVVYCTSLMLYFAYRLSLIAYRLLLILYTVCLCQCLLSTVHRLYCTSLIAYSLSFISGMGHTAYLYNTPYGIKRVFYRIGQIGPYYTITI